MALRNLLFCLKWEKDLIFIHTIYRIFLTLTFVNYKQDPDAMNQSLNFSSSGNFSKSYIVLGMDYMQFVS